MYKPCTLATHFGWEISEEIASPRKNLPSRLSSPLELCPNPLALLFELPASHCIEHSLPLRGGWITQASLPQAPLKEFPSFPTASELSFVLFLLSLWPPCSLRENILKTAKALVEDTKLLVSGAASTPDKLAQAAQSSAATITQLAEVVKLGAASLGSNDPETQV